MKKNLLLFAIFSLFLVSCAKKIITYDYIPMRYHGHIHLDVKVQDTIHGDFIFDTGWSGICLDSLFCKKNKFDYETADVKLSGIGNETRTGKFFRDTVNYVFGAKEYRFSTLTVITDLKGMIGNKLDGVAGVETFAQKPYMIDYVSQKIIFMDSVKGYEPVNAQFEGRDIFLSSSITLENGKKIQGKFLLDTGSNRTVLNSNFLNTDGIHNAEGKTKFLSKGGVGGDSNGYFLPVAAVDLGKFRIKKLNITISTDTLGWLASPDHMGIIGNDLLDDFNVIFDHQKEKIWIKPNKNFDKNERKLFSSISFLDAGEKWLVGMIVEDSEAYRLGIRMNDQIVEVNNIPVKNIDLDTFVEKLKPNDNLRLKIKQGNEEKEIQFKLKVF